MVEIIKTHTGKIYVDRERKLEFLTVGDYGAGKSILQRYPTPWYT
jgi:23S rRNA (adenine2503-C2)-methyltransferase